MRLVGVQDPSPPVLTRIDTVIVRDTITVIKPRPITRYVSRVDSIPVYIRDTQKVYVALPIERKRYQSAEYDLTIEGYASSLLSIQTFNKTVYIDKVQTLKTKPRWGIGVQAGYGYAVGSNKTYPYVGIGVQYNLITW